MAPTKEFNGAWLHKDVDRLGLTYSPKFARSGKYYIDVDLISDDKSVSSVSL